MFYLEQRGGNGRWVPIDEFSSRVEAEKAAMDLATYSGRRTRVVQKKIVKECKP